MEKTYTQVTPEEQQLAQPSEGEENLPVQALSGGISPLAWRVFVLMWLVFVVYAIFQLIQARITLFHLVVALVAAVGFSCLYTWLVWPHPLSFQAQARARAGFTWLPFALLIALTIFLNLAYGSSWLWYFIFSSMVAGVIFPTRRAGPVILGLALLTLGLGLFLLGSNWQQFAIPVLLVAGLGLGIIGAIRSFDTIRELQLARSELARMAVVEERFRLARDLHDLLGQKLSMITLKSELAGRLLEKAPERAAKEVRDIEQVARQTLHEVRAAVAGYRQPRLESELENARQMLEAAGIACSITQVAGALPSSVDAVLAWTVREGVTNVIRHSRAHQCLIRLTCEREMVCVEVVNDGYQVLNKTHLKSGTGLTGVSERVSILGGHFEAGPLYTNGTQRFRLWIELPLVEL